MKRPLFASNYLVECKQLNTRTHINALQRKRHDISTPAFCDHCHCHQQTIATTTCQFDQVAATVSTVHRSPAHKAASLNCGGDTYICMRLNGNAIARSRGQYEYLVWITRAVGQKSKNAVVTFHPIPLLDGLHDRT